MYNRILTGIILIASGMCILIMALTLKPEGISLAALLTPSILCNITGIAFIAPILKLEKRR